MAEALPLSKLRFRSHATAHPHGALDQAPRARQIAAPNGRCGRFSPCAWRNRPVGPPCTTNPPRQNPDRRFWLAGDPAHRAARARGRRSFARSLPFQKAQAAFDEMRPKGVILSGGPHPCSIAARRWRQKRSSRQACRCSASAYGEQAMAAQLGGKVEPATTASSAAPKSRSRKTRLCSRGCG